MSAFPRTIVGGRSVSRLIIGTNWFLGYSHQTTAKGQIICDYVTVDRMVDIIKVFLKHDIDTIMGPPHPALVEATRRAEQDTGKALIRVYTPTFQIRPDDPPQTEPERILDEVAAMDATFCLPHQCVTDALLDRRSRTIRDMDVYAKMIRERGMIPGLSTHMPEAVIYADATDLDCETYIQIFNGSGFLMQVEIDWILSVIRAAKKPVMTIKPLAAGRLEPLVGMTFVWNALRDEDMVTVGTMSPQEAEEIIEISRACLERRHPELNLQKTRSKASLEA